MIKIMQGSRFSLFLDGIGTQLLVVTSKFLTLHQLGFAVFFFSSLPPLRYPR